MRRHVARRLDGRAVHLPPPVHGYGMFLAKLHAQRRFRSVSAESCDFLDRDGSRFQHHFDIFQLDIAHVFFDRAAGGIFEFDLKKSCRTVQFGCDIGNRDAASDFGMYYF